MQSISILFSNNVPADFMCLVFKCDIFYRILDLFALNRLLFISLILFTNLKGTVHNNSVVISNLHGFFFVVHKRRHFEES